MARGGNTVPSITNAEHIGPDDTGDNIEAKRVANYVWNGNDWERESSSVASAEGGATEDYQEIQADILNEIRSAIQAVASARGIAADLRVTLLGGTTAVTGTLTAVTTVGGLTNIGGLPATQIVPATTNTTAVLSNINNVV